MKLSFKILAFFAFCSLTAQGAGFDISGEITANCLSISYEVKAPFHVLIDGHKWQIEVQFKRYTEYCWSDGVQVYWFDMFPPVKRDTTLPGARILSGTYPFFSDPSVRLVWLAFASSDYLNANTNTMPSLCMMDFLDPVCEAFGIKNLELLGNDNQLKIVGVNLFL